MKVPNDWKLYSLEIDKAGKRLGRFFKSKDYEITRIKKKSFPALFSWYPWLIKKEDLEKHICKNIDNNKKSLLVYGEGVFHHFAYALCRLADKKHNEYSYIHIDHHHDSYRFNKKGLLDCGNFVNQIALSCNVKRGKGKQNIIFIGNNVLFKRYPLDTDYAITEDDLRTKKGKRTLEDFLEDTPKKAYVSIDLDVMLNKEIPTSYDRGTLRKEELIDILNSIKAKKEIIGADIVGYNWSSLNIGGIFLRKKSLKLYQNIVQNILEMS